MNNPIRVLQVSYADSGGGAARAAYRIHQVLNSTGQRINSTFRTIHSEHPDKKNIIAGRSPRKFRTRVIGFFARKISDLLKIFFHSSSNQVVTLALKKTGMAQEINSSEYDLVQLNWLGEETISISEIGDLNLPIVWRLSDSWPFSGAEHYLTSNRYEKGYSTLTRPSGEMGLDLNRWVYNRKAKHWQGKKILIISPTIWLAKLARKSPLSVNWKVCVIPNPINPDFWFSIGKQKARLQIGIEEEASILLFGAPGGLIDGRKGGDLLLEIIKLLSQGFPASSRIRPIKVRVFGQNHDSINVSGIPIDFLGVLNDEELRAEYSAADLLLFPARQDNLPSVAIEAQTCSLPVIAFDVGGLSEIVQHKQTGYLVDPFDLNQYSEKIIYLLQNPDVLQEFSNTSRDLAIQKWSPEVIEEMYFRAYEEAINFWNED